MDLYDELKAAFWQLNRSDVGERARRQGFLIEPADLAAVALSVVLARGQVVIDLRDPPAPLQRHTPRVE